MLPQLPGSGEFALHHGRWDNSVSPDLLTQGSVVCASTLPEIPQKATHSGCPLPQVALDFQWRMLLYFFQNFVTHFHSMWKRTGMSQCKCGGQRSLCRVSSLLPPLHGL